MENNYQLPELNFSYDELTPFISEEQLKIHHTKHHQAYVDAANKIMDEVDLARKEAKEINQKAVLKEFSFNLGGHILHSLFWKNLAPEQKTTEIPEGKIKELIEKEFGSFERFREEFTKTAVSVEGSGWAALTYCNKTKKLFLMQIEKHNQNIFPAHRITLVLDVWEHAYYLDYKNARPKFVEAFWKNINWQEVNKRLE